MSPSMPWYADGLRFSCTQCGRCCGGPPGHVWVSDDEVAAIAAHLKMSLAEFEARHVRRAERRRSLLELPDGDCEFLRTDPDGKKRCSIYAVRPEQCRTWPFWQSNLRTPRDWERAGRTCPGIDTGSTHPLPVIQESLLRNRDAKLPL
ncbi:MAG: YkgJ family cysteine cluster protein [Planctomycetia bacterium]|nr:MAG: YkgJ family cysteine cluster protein [Planctomycetia bacterium]